LLCLASTALQLSYWQDSIKLFQHAVQVTKGNYVACEHLANNLYQLGKKDEALPYYAESVRIRPHRADAQYNLGTLLMELGRAGEAVIHLSEASRLNPKNAATQVNLALALISQGTPHYFEATAAAIRARNLALAAGQTQLVDRADELLRMCASGQPSPAETSHL
jgi:tetratricopeptide (TPR) repeat protein